MKAGENQSCAAFKGYRNCILGAARSGLAIILFGAIDRPGKSLHAGMGWRLNEQFHYACAATGERVTGLARQFLRAAARIFGRSDDDIVQNMVI